MSPILNETDPSESGPVDIKKTINGFVNVCRQEPDHAPKNVKRRVVSAATGSTDNAKEKIANVRRRSLGNLVSARLSLPKDQKELFDPEPKVAQSNKKESPLKRSQSLRLKSKSSHDSSKLSQASHIGGGKNKVSTSLETKEGKVSKSSIKSFASRFTRFSKPSNTNSIDIIKYESSPRNLRRSQSMRFSSKKSFLSKTFSENLKPSTSSTHLPSAKENRHSFSRSTSLSHVNAGLSAYDRSNSLKVSSKTDTRHSARNLHIKDSKFSNELHSRQNGEYHSLSNILENPKSKDSVNSSLMLTKETSTSKTFGYKTFSVFKTKLKGSSKTNLATASQVSSEKPAKDMKPIKALKLQSKRKKNESNESDSELKPKKKVDQRESPERIDFPKKRSTKSILKNKNHSKSAITPLQKSRSATPIKLDNDDITNLNNIVTQIDDTPSQNAINFNSKPVDLKMNIFPETSENFDDKIDKRESYLKGSGLLYTLFFEDGYKVENPSFGRSLINSPNVGPLDYQVSDDLPYFNTDPSELNIYEDPSTRDMCCSLSEMCCSESSMAMSFNGSEHKSPSPMSLSLYDDEFGKNHQIDSPMSTAEYDDFYTWKAFEDSYLGTIYSDNENSGLENVGSTNPSFEITPGNAGDEPMKCLEGDPTTIESNSKTLQDRRRRFSDASLERKKELRQAKEFRHSFPVSDYVVSNLSIENDALKFQPLKEDPKVLPTTSMDHEFSTNLKDDCHANNTISLDADLERKESGQNTQKKKIIISVRMMPKGKNTTCKDDHLQKDIQKQTTCNFLSSSNSHSENRTSHKKIKDLLNETPLKAFSEDKVSTLDTPFTSDVKLVSPSSKVDVKRRGAEGEATSHQIRRSKDNKTSQARIPQKISRQNSAPLLRKLSSPEKNTGSSRKKSAPQSIDADKLKRTPRGISPCHSDVSTSSDQSHASNLVPGIIPRRPLRNLHAPSSSPRSLIATISEKKISEGSHISSRRAKIDSPNSGLNKGPRSTSHKHPIADPVKVARPSLTNGQAGRGHVQGSIHALSEQLKKLEADLSERNTQVTSAREETKQAVRGVEALTVLVHYLTREYDAFSTPKLKSEVDRVCSQLTHLQLCLDESCATVQRLEADATERSEAHLEEVETLQQRHLQEVSLLHQRHREGNEEINAKHDIDLRKFAEEQDCKREEITRCHKDDVEKIENDWHFQLDLQHERHLQALQQLNNCHFEKLLEAEETWNRKEKELQEVNFKVTKERENLKLETKELEQTLLNDKDHRLQAAKRVCSSFQQEVDSLKTVIEMRNAEMHKLRDQIADKERISEELEGSREKVKALQAKTEDLQAQMEKKSEVERRLMADHKGLMEAIHKENSTNKRLSLDNEELQWKLRQRELAMAVSLPTSTLDLVTRSSTGFARHQEGGTKCGGSSPQLYPRSPRLSMHNGARRTPGGTEHARRWSHSVDNSQNEGKSLTNPIGEHRDVLFESPPPSPCVKAVIEKSNSVSFILDLNDTCDHDSFLDFPPSPILKKKHRNPSLTIKGSKRSFGAALEKSTSSPYICHRPIRESDNELNGGDDLSPINGNVFHPRDERDTLINRLSPERSVKEIEEKFKHFRRGYSTSESSDSGDIDRISPTGLAWTVPVHSKASHRFKKYPITPATNGRYPLTRPQSLCLLQQHPDEDEYEEMENGDEFVEVLEIGDSLNATPLSSLLSRTPATSVSLSDSDISQCGSRGEISTESEDSSEEEDGTQVLSLGAPNHSSKDQIVPQEGAGEAMIPSDLFALKSNIPEKICAKEISSSQFSSALSSDSEDPLHVLQDTLNISWSEDVDGDLTSSSEMQEL